MQPITLSLRVKQKSELGTVIALMLLDRLDVQPKSSHVVVQEDPEVEEEADAVETVFSRYEKSVM